MLVIQPTQAAPPEAASDTTPQTETATEELQQQGVAEPQPFDQAAFDAFTDDGDADFGPYEAGSARAAEDSAVRQEITAESLDVEQFDMEDAATAAADDCASSYNYNFHDYECQAFAGDFVFLYDIKNNPGDTRGVPAAAGPNGRPTAVVDMINAIDEAQSAYRSMGYPVDPGDGPWAVIVGLNDTQEGWFNGGAFTLPFGANDQPMIILPSDPGLNDADNYDYLPRHEFFHIVQYQYWDDVGDIGWAYVQDWLGGSDFKTMNWWMESTAEWATLMSYRLQPYDPRNPTAATMYAHAIPEHLGDPGRALNAAEDLGSSRQYSTFTLAFYLNEATGSATAVRKTWEHIKNHDSTPITAIKAVLTSYGLDIPSTLLGYSVANYRLAAEQGGAPPNPMAGYGYNDTERDLWRDFLMGDTRTDDHLLEEYRPARTTRAVPLGTQQTYAETIEPGGSAYFDFSAMQNSGDPTSDYRSRLTISTEGRDDLQYVAMVWSPQGSPGSLSEYPTAARAVYPDAGNVITVTDFAYPMVVTLIATRTDLQTNSVEADGDGREYRFRVRALVPLDHPSCNLSSLTVSNLQDDGVAPEQQFLDYAESTPNGWTGGDSTYSVRLPDGDLLWLFSDTFLGPLNSDGTRPVTAPLINSTFVRQDGGSLSTIQGGTTANPEAIMPPPEANHWYWLGDGMISRQNGTDYLQVVFQEYLRFGTGDWDWRFDQNVVATFSLSNLSDPISVEPLPSQAGAWGSALLPASQSGDGYTYIYGIADAPTNKKQRIARVHGSDLGATAKWQYWTADGWTAYESDTGVGLNGIANEYSVTKWNGQYVLVTQDSTLAFNNKVYAYTSCSPAGPFTNQSLVYSMPETGLWGSYGDERIFAYNAHLHPTISSGNRFVMSYNVNTFDSRMTAEGSHYTDPSIYKPRFISFTLN
ncbi:hypothetical protein [Glycomyces dulcitolivorans]|uniref:hypothetical protein n=1 Tax=Glycomyces dulcitolivorans TaxID=2200759 RepID=UPI000DD40E1F|nr:hypothetical protein [Glycomyces dulcitolivorans]